VKEFNKVYASLEEREARRAVFEARLAKIRAHNADPTKTWKEGVNHLTDRHEHEFRRLLGYKPAKPAFLTATAPVPAAIRDFDFTQMPEKVDWREKSVVSPVKDQGQCGSCWTFATAETVESHWGSCTLSCFSSSFFTFRSFSSFLFLFSFSFLPLISILAGAAALKTGQLAVLSEQQILDCTPNPNQCGGTGACANVLCVCVMRVVRVRCRISSKVKC
jgi:cathepsin L